MRQKITEFYVLKSSYSTVAGGVGFWRGFVFFLLVVVAFYVVDMHKSAPLTVLMPCVLFAALLLSMLAMTAG